MGKLLYLPKLLSLTQLTLRKLGYPAYLIEQARRASVSSRLPCGAWLYTLGGLPTSVNARHCATVTREEIARQVLECTGVSVRIEPALGRANDLDPVYVCYYEE